MVEAFRSMRACRSPRRTRLTTGARSADAVQSLAWRLRSTRDGTAAHGRRPLAVRQLPPCCERRKSVPERRIGSRAHQSQRRAVRDDSKRQRFPRRLMQRIFEPYVTTKPKGTGLGLVIVKKIIEEHGGSVEIANVAPHGARVTLNFPAGAVQAAAVKTAARA